MSCVRYFSHIIAWDKVCDLGAYLLAEEAVAMRIGEEDFFDEIKLVSLEFPNLRKIATVLQHFIEAHQIEVTMTDVSLYSGQVLGRAKEQRFVAWVKVDVAGKYRIEVSNLAQVTLNLHLFQFGDLEGNVGIFLGRDSR